MIWAQAGDGGTIPLTGLGQLGAVGGVLAILFWFSWKVYNREKDRADKNEDEIKRLNDLIQEKYVPSLEAATHALTEVNEHLRKLPKRRA